jgi:hypothetical protein
MLIFSVQKCSCGIFDHYFLVFICMHFPLCGILRRWSLRELAAYEVDRDWRNFEKHRFGQMEYVQSVWEQADVKNILV